MQSKGRAAGRRDSPLAERFDRTGLSGFTDEEILELLLEYTSVRPEERRSRAAELIAAFGSVERMFRAGQPELMEKGGFTEKSAALFRVIPEVIRVSSPDSMRDTVCPDVGTLEKIFQPCFLGAGEECLLMASFDSKLELRGVDRISTGTGCCTRAGMREIADRAAGRDIHIIAISHNHPFGSCAPSGEDISVTRELCRACAFLDIYMMDHIIVGNDGCYSMRAHGDIIFLD